MDFEFLVLLCEDIYLSIIMSGFNHQSLSISPARGIPSPDPRINSGAESEYLKELMMEMQKLGPFMQAFPICGQLLHQEISRISSKVFWDHDVLLGSGSSNLAYKNVVPDVAGTGNWTGNGSAGIQLESIGGPQWMTVDRQTLQGNPNSLLVKRIMRVDIPVGRYPDYNFVGRLLGPRGNSLKRLEASTGCRIFIRGKGSIKDPHKEEMMRGKRGYEHLNEPLHVLIEEEAPANAPDGQLQQAKDIIEGLLKPVNASQDFYKKGQLKELAMLKHSRA